MSQPLPFKMSEQECIMARAALDYWMHVGGGRAAASEARALASRLYHEGSDHFGLEVMERASLSFMARQAEQMGLADELRKAGFLPEEDDHADPPEGA